MQQQAPVGSVSTVAPSNALVFSSSSVRSWHTERAGEPGIGFIEADRFEFARNDSRLAPASRGPLLATREWPEAPRPAERRIIFRRWQQ
ncbi:MAG: hypothetical protein ACNA8P_07560 [Phycisphaerales bacterium]